MDPSKVFFAFWLAGIVAALAAMVAGEVLAQRRRERGL